jgi:hypothetical protein
MEQSAGALADGRLAAGLDDMEQRGARAAAAQPRYRIEARRSSRAGVGDERWQ